MTFKLARFAELTLVGVGAAAARSVDLVTDVTETAVGTHRVDAAAVGARLGHHTTFIQV
jgi:hypothetical protein